MAKLKVIKHPTEGIRINAVKNGYRVQIGTENSFSSQMMEFWNSSVGEAGVRHEYLSGEYVFPDFPSLTRWLRDNLKHGKPVKAGAK